MGTDIRNIKMMLSKNPEKRGSWGNRFTRRKNIPEINRKRLM
jgi:hypothetical protein